MRPVTYSAIVLALVALAGLALSPVRGDLNVASTEPLSPEQERGKFHLPPGFEAQLVAAEPDIHKPMNLAFDDRGRLWVTDTVEYPFPAKEGTKPRDTVKVLDDFDANGRARKITTFADGLNIPIGVLPLADARSAFVFSIPNIYRLTDTDGDGKADRREVVCSGFGFNDTHGMTSAFTWGFDGWIYACHGFSNTSNVKGTDGVTVRMQSGNTYRLKADGSHAEQHTWGQVNPFGLALDPLGNLYSADCHSRPVYQLLRGGHYPSFGKPHDGLGFAPEMMRHDHGSTAIAGIVYYTADHFPRGFDRRVYIGNVITNRINVDLINWRGSTPQAVKQADFLRSDDQWFRPVDLKIGPDGALYIADFYNRIIGHYEVPLTHPGRDRERGRIWRIVYKGQPTDSAPPVPLTRTDWTRASVDELVKALDHGNLTVRITAANQLVARGGEPGIKAVKAVMQPRSALLQRLHGLWVLERCGALDEQTLAAAAARTEDHAVRTQAMRILSERARLNPAERGLLLAALKGGSQPEQRAAADALARHPAPENLRPLLDLLPKVLAEDTHLRYVVRMALRDNLRPASAWKHLPLDPWTHADAMAVSDAAMGVPSREAAAYQLEFLRQGGGPPDHTVRVVRHIARHGSDEHRRELIARVRRVDFGSAELGQRHARFRAYEEGTQERGGALEDEARAWAAELSALLFASANSGDRLSGIELAGRLRLAAAEKELLQCAGPSAPSEKHRIAAFNSLAAIDAEKHTPLLGRVLADAKEPLTVREQAAAVLARLNRATAHAQLLAALPTAPARLQTAIALGLSAGPAGVEKLLEAVSTGKASARLLRERPIELRLQESKLPGLKERLAKLTEGLPPADQRLQELLNARRGGFASAQTDATLGRKVFEKHCAACHQLANQGAKIGPQLDGIGTRGLDRLLEDLLDPNRNIDQAFRSTTLGLKNGQVVSGLLLREEGEVLVMADAQGKEVRVPKGTVEARSIAAISPMPANVSEQIDEKDLYHLLAYLLEQRAGEKKGP